MSEEKKQQQEQQPAEVSTSKYQSQPYQLKPEFKGDIVEIGHAHVRLRLERKAQPFIFTDERDELAAVGTGLLESVAAAQARAAQEQEHEA